MSDNIADKYIGYKIFHQPSLLPIFYILKFKSKTKTYTSPDFCDIISLKQNKFDFTAFCVPQFLKTP